MTVSSVPPTANPETTPASDYVLREYKSPTCTLEISAIASPLARWTRKPTLKNQRFNLRFDDARVSEDQWTVLRGDRIKLEALTDTVTTYVQTFLTRSNSRSFPETDADLTDTDRPENPILSPQGIALQPKGLLAHTLTLGTLATEATGPDMTLTSTQLADLASVLDEHSAETIALPVLKRDFAWVRSPAVWGKVAAGTILSLGLTATVLNQFNKPTNQQIATTSASSNDQRTAPVPLPSPSLPSPLPGVSIPSNLPPAGNTNLPPNLSGGTPIASNPSGTESSTPSGDTTASPNGTASEATPAEKSDKKVVVSKTTPEMQDTPTQDIPVPGNLTKPARQPNSSVASAPVAPIPGSAGRTRLETPGKIETGETEDPTPPPVVDRTAQLGKIKEQVTAQWKPTEKVPEDLSYLLEVSATGQLISVEPQSDLAKKSVNLLPEPGTSIASPLPAGSKAYKVLLVFSPDGSLSAAIIP